MRPSFHPRLINDPFGDPGLFIPFLFQKRALIFDLGEINGLAAKDILKISHAFVTHTHMDHFIGLDHLLRIMLGREKTLSIFGPRDFLSNLEGKLSGYTWNLADKYNYPLSLQATEVHPHRTISRRYCCRNRFEPRQDVVEAPFDGLLYEEPAFRVSAVILDHQIPCLGFSVKERFHVNIIREGLNRLSLAPGPWLSEFKQALYDGKDPGATFELGQAGAPVKKKFVLAELAGQIARITPGQKITYITDVLNSDANQRKIMELARDSDHLFIEAVFLEKDRELARAKGHLTARQAGHIAARSGARQFEIFHFSPRYADRQQLLYEEALAAFKQQPPV
ncbi:Metal-dependent hydrolases of the beta-lactamase superfamily III [Olavius algarvensis Delta 1 endosymbiont]|nr:Metal-dependent hydrolases of the beta-lactamase superfamily III [Olavius algarvensis Delta 1 endosymbiont]